MATLDYILAALDCAASLATVASVVYFATTTTARKAIPCDQPSPMDLDGAGIHLTAPAVNGTRTTARSASRAA